MIDWTWVSGWFAAGVTTVVLLWSAVHSSSYDSPSTSASICMFVSLIVTTPMLAGVAFASFLIGSNTVSQAVAAFALACAIAIVTMVVVFFHKIATIQVTCPKCARTAITPRCQIVER
jgi:hypothetical protein